MKCLLCFKILPQGSIHWHLKNYHSLTIAEYRQKFNIPSQSAHGRGGKKGYIPWNKMPNEKVTCFTCGKNFKVTRSKYLVYKRAESNFYCSKECGKIGKCKNIAQAKKLDATNIGLKSKATWANPEIRERRIKALPRGDNHHNWKDGSTPVNFKIRSSPRYFEWRKRIFERDHFTCQTCGTHGCQIHADHYPTSFSSILNWIRESMGSDNLYDKAMSYEPLWDIENGRTLCVPCHKETDNYLSRGR